MENIRTTLKDLYKKVEKHALSLQSFIFNSINCLCFYKTFFKKATAELMHGALEATSKLNSRLAEDNTNQLASFFLFFFTSVYIFVL